MLSALKTKRARAGLGLLVLLAFAGAAVAYFSSSGTGTGNAQVGSSSALTISATVPPSTSLVPGGPAATVQFSVNNPGSGNEYVGTVHLKNVLSYTNSSMTTETDKISGNGTCDTSAFQMSDVAANQDVPSGSTTLTKTGSLSFNDNNTNQDGCQNAYLVANFTSN